MIMLTGIYDKNHKDIASVIIGFCFLLKITKGPEI